ncbi:MAG TPA: error-prone DNA polymerase [Longimicrobium sp.]|jgi:error-prone DNA polymerase
MVSARVVGLMGNGEMGNGEWGGLASGAVVRGGLTLLPPSPDGEAGAPARIHARGAVQPFPIPHSPFPNYVELRARSAFSFGDGAVAPETLAERAAELGFEALALCDAADLGGIIRFALAAKTGGVRPIAGAELRVDGHPVGLLARDEVGFRNLSALVSHARLENGRGEAGVSFDVLAERSEGVHVLTGPASGPIGARILEQRPEEARYELARWRGVFGERLAVEVQRHHVSGAEGALVDALIETAERAGVPWVVTNEPRYLDAEGRRVHDLQTALRHGVDYDTALRRGLLLPNGEWRLKGPAEMALLWQGREAGLEESARIAEQCTFDMRWLRPPLPRFDLPEGHTDDSFLAEKVLEGAIERWGGIDEKQQRQIEHELRVIEKLGFSGFFLIMWDAVRFARRRGILCQGRGSAANSAVAYCLSITAVDPVRHGLLFERFLSEARADGGTEAPDIDVDFEADRREEVLNYVYEKYSRQHAAITAVTQMYSAPTAIQDMMRALGYPAEQAFRLSKRLHWAGPAEGAEALAGELGQEQGFDAASPRGRALIAAVRAVEGLPRMRSTHPGGFVLSSRPLGEALAIERTTMGRTILQFDKDDLDAAGVPKFDFLGLGGLTAVRIAFDQIERRTGVRPLMYDLPQDDPETFRMISAGDTLGTFQIESRAQIQSIVQTRPERIYDIVVQVALIRPGPIVAHFVKPYTRRRRGIEEVTFPHPDLEPILARTQGIPIFQEQAMAISMALGGYTAMEADELRRTMGNSRKAAKLRVQIERLRERMKERGIDAEVAERITEDMRIFANYGFPESHAWSFGLIAYATAYLKAHHPAEFLVGLLNAQPMGFYSPATLVHDAMRHGVEVRAPCLRDGDWDATLEETADPARPAVRVGWRQIRGMGAKAREALREARAEGPFRSIEDLVRRTGFGRADALHLARAGALEAWEPGRHAAAWEALRAAADTLPLAPAHRLPFRARELEGSERIFLDYLATGVSVAGHPVQHLRPRLNRIGAHSSADLHRARPGTHVLVAGLVVARQHPSTSKGTVFVLLEDEWGFINVIVPPALFLEHKEVVKHSPFLLVEGKFEQQGPVLNVVGRRFKRMEAGALAHTSHDFR